MVPVLTWLAFITTFIAMYIEPVPNRNSPPAVLLRESYRHNGKVKKRTLANLSKWPDHIVNGLRILLKGGVALPSMGHAFAILRSRPHGHVAAVLGSARRLRLEQLIDRKLSRQRALVTAMVLDRILDPRSKLATARSLNSETLTHTLGEELGIGDADERELYQAMDWLLRRQDRIERHLAARHLRVRWCPAMSHRSTSRARRVRSPSAATLATPSVASFRSSLPCCVTGTAAPWPWTCSRATLPIRARWVPRSRRCATNR